MLKPRYTSVLIAIMFISSCVHRDNSNGAMEIEQDSLSIFPPSMTFVSTNENDQIALLFMRDTLSTFKYRIELLRKWKGLPHDYGILQLDRIESDSIYVFRGGNIGCEVEIRICNNIEGFKMGRQYVKLKRKCKDSSLDIALDEFQKLRYKGS